MSQRDPAFDSPTNCPICRDDRCAGVADKGKSCVWSRPVHGRAAPPPDIVIDEDTEEIAVNVSFDAETRELEVEPVAAQPAEHSFWQKLHAAVLNRSVESVYGVLAERTTAQPAEPAPPVITQEVVEKVADILGESNEVAKEFIDLELPYRLSKPAEPACSRGGLFEDNSPGKEPAEPALEELRKRLQAEGHRLLLRALGVEIDTGQADAGRAREVYGVTFFVTDLYDAAAALADVESLRQHNAVLAERLAATERDRDELKAEVATAWAEVAVLRELAVDSERNKLAST